MPVWVPAGPTLPELLAGTAGGVGVALARPLVLAAAAARRDSATRRARTSARHPPAGRTPPTGRLGPVGGEPDPGWFGPGSTAWKVQADTSMFVAGVAAFALQLLHPLALAGVVDHSSFAEDFLGRVERTGEFVQGVVYGDTAEAERRCARVRAVHRRVVGTAPDGRPYDASDPALLEWVHLGEYLAIAAAYRRFGALPLDDDELDSYVDEVAVAGEGVGVPDPPHTWAQLDAALQQHRPQLAVGEQTAAALRFLAEPPGLPAAARPAWRVAYAGGVACLPPWARRLLHLDDPSPLELIACRTMVRGLQALIGSPPPLVEARRRLGLAPDAGTSGRPTGHRR
jgi:uncharacterized protein (DUF2236 family)